MATPDYSELLVQELKKIDDRYYQDSLKATALANADLSQESHFHHDFVVAQENLSAALTDSADINAINTLTAQADLVSKKLLAFAQNASNDAVKANAGVAVAATSIETAAEAIVELNSFLASVLSIAKAEDARTNIDASAAAAAQMARQLAADVEALTLQSMNAAILASQTVNAGNASQAAKELEKDISGVASTMETLFDQALAELNTAREAARTAEQRLSEELQALDIATDQETALQDAIDFLNQEVNMELTATDKGGTFESSATGNEETTHFVSRIEVSNPGSGYTATPTVTILGGGGSGATAVARVDGGSLTAIEVTHSGKGYTTLPQVQIDAPRGANGIQAVAKPVVVGLTGELEVSYQVYIKYDHGKLGWQWDPQYDPILNPAHDWDEGAKVFEAFRIVIIPADEVHDFDLKAALALESDQYNVIELPPIPPKDEFNPPQPVLLPNLNLQAYVNAGMGYHGTDVDGKVLLMGTSYQAVFWAVTKSDHKLNVPRETDLSLPTDPFLLEHHLLPPVITNAFLDEKDQIQIFFEPSKPTGEDLYCEYWAFAIREDEVENFEGYVVSPPELRLERRLLLANHLQESNAIKVNPAAQRATIPAEMTDFFGVPIDPDHTYHVYILTVGKTINILKPGMIPDSSVEDCEVIPMENLAASGLQKVPNVLSETQQVTLSAPTESEFKNILDTDFFNNLQRLRNETGQNIQDLATNIQQDMEELFSIASDGMDQEDAVNAAKSAALELLGLYDQGAFKLKAQFVESSREMHAAYPLTTLPDGSTTVTQFFTDSETSLDEIKGAQRQLLEQYLDQLYSNAKTRAAAREASEQRQDDKAIQDQLNTDVNSILKLREKDLDSVRKVTQEEAGELISSQNLAEREITRATLGDIVEEVVSSIANSLADPTDMSKKQKVEDDLKIFAGKVIIVRQRFGTDNEAMKRLVAQVVESEVDVHASSNLELGNRATVRLQEILNANWQPALNPDALSIQDQAYLDQVSDLYLKAGIEMEELALEARIDMDKLIHIALTGQNPAAALTFAESVVGTGDPTETTTLLATFRDKSQALITEVANGRTAIEAALDTPNPAVASVLDTEKTALETTAGALLAGLNSDKGTKFGVATTEASALETKFDSEDQANLNEVLTQEQGEMTTETASDVEELETQASEDVEDQNAISAELTTEVEDYIRNNTNFATLVSNTVLDIANGIDPGSRDGFIKGRITTIMNQFGKENEEAKDRLIALTIEIIEDASSDPEVRDTAKGRILLLVEDRWTTS